MNTDKKPVVLFQLKRYLEQQKQVKHYTEANVEVPALLEIAEHIGITKHHLSVIVNNRQDGLSRTHLAQIMFYLRERGLNVEIADLLEYVEISD